MASIKNKSHIYLFIFGVVLFIAFLIYIYVCEHKFLIEHNNIWKNAFSRNGVPLSQIKDIYHDDNMWYYKRRPTCVGYSEKHSKKCNNYENYCSDHNKYGKEDQQVLSVKKAISNGGEHPKCPLFI